MHKTIATFISVSFLAGAAHAEVVTAAANGFTIKHTVDIDADRATVYAATVANVGEWWNDDHTFSGDASNMYIEARPAGCFCETLGENGGLVHMTITFVNPGVMLRLTGGLGPLGLMGVDGNMTWEFEEADDGTRIVLNYAVGGYDPNGLDNIAPAVDFVLGEQLRRLKLFVETGRPTD